MRIQKYFWRFQTNQIVNIFFGKFSAVDWLEKICNGFFQVPFPLYLKNPGMIVVIIMM